MKNFVKLLGGLWLNTLSMRTLSDLCPCSGPRRRLGSWMGEVSLVRFAQDERCSAQDAPYWHWEGAQAASHPLDIIVLCVRW